jgi:hypothetical protein
MNRKAIPLIALLIVLIGATSSAFAQTHRKVTLQASVPFAFEVGNRSFPAGSYIFEMATGSPAVTDKSAVLVVRSSERKLYAAVATDITAMDAAPAAHKVEFVREGGRVYLAKVWHQGNAAGLNVHGASGQGTEADSQESEVLSVNAVPVLGGI